MRCTQSVEAGAYVLGALSPAERSSYQRHMATCDECRDEVTDLAGLPGLLGRLDEATAAGLDPSPDTGRAPVFGEPAPPTLLTDVLGRVGGERRRLRRGYRLRAAFLAAAAACLALVAGLGISGATHTASGPPRVAAMHAALAGEPVAAVIGLRARASGGTDISMGCLYMDAAKDNSDRLSLRLMVFPRDGNSTSVWDWVAVPNQYQPIEAHSELSPAQIDRIEVQLANGTPLLTYEVT